MTDEEALAFAFNVSAWFPGGPDQMEKGLIDIVQAAYAKGIEDAGSSIGLGQYFRSQPVDEERIVQIATLAEGENTCQGIAALTSRGRVLVRSHYPEHEGWDEWYDLSAPLPPLNTKA